MNVATTIFLFVMFHALADADQFDTFDIQCSPDPETKTQIGAIIEKVDALEDKTDEVKEKLEGKLDHLNQMLEQLIANNVESKLVELKDIAQSVEEKVDAIDKGMTDLLPLTQTVEKKLDIIGEKQNELKPITQTVEKKIDIIDEKLNKLKPITDSEAIESPVFSPTTTTTTTSATTITATTSTTTSNNTTTTSTTTTTSPDCPYKVTAGYTTGYNGTKAHAQYPHRYGSYTRQNKLLYGKAWYTMDDDKIYWNSVRTLWSITNSGGPGEAPGLEAGSGIYTKDNTDCPHTVLSWRYWDGKVWSDAGESFRISGYN